MNGSRIRQIRPSFTLVELLVVIVILSVLMALITSAAAGAFTRAKEVAIKVELDNIDMALKAYRTEYGEYPPSDFSDKARVRRHLQKRYPRADLSGYTIPTLTPAQALVYWLEGFWQNPLDPMTPFKSSDLSQGREVALIDFDPSRLIDPSTNKPFKTGGTRPYYVPTHGVGKPYLYFESSTYKTANYTTTDGTRDKTGTESTPIGKKPYLADENVPYENPRSFQIISAGLDGDYGRITDKDDKNSSFPSGTDYSQGDWDNITNFSQRNLKVSQP